VKHFWFPFRTQIADTLKAVIHAGIEPGTMVISDCYAAYKVPSTRRHNPNKWHLPQHVHAHAHCKSESAVSKVFSVCFPRQPNTTDVPRARITICVGCYICPTFYSSTKGCTQLASSLISAVVLYLALPFLINTYCKFPANGLFTHLVPTHFAL
jgi:hypothetical protein